MPTTVPFFTPDITERDITACAEVLRSGWLTTGPCVREFEQAFASAVGARHAVAVNSCTAALHLALEAIGLRPNQGVLVPTMTFAATAEVVRYFGAVPLLVDCDPVTGNLSLDAAEERLAQVRAGRWRPARRVTDVVGIMPVHVGGLMLDIGAVRRFAARHGLWVVEDAAHALPAAWRPDPDAPWQRCGEDTADVTCYSFYANKTITTGEGGMAVTASAALADRMRLMSLHGLSHDAWNRYTGHGSWDYRIVAPGYKYNLTDIAAALGLRQLARAESMRQARARIAAYYCRELAGEPGIALPPNDPDRVHAWHLFPIRVEGDPGGARRDTVIGLLRNAGVACSVHWRPLHMHPYYEETFGYQPGDCPTAAALFPTLISLPIFSKMTGPQMDAVVAGVRTAVRALPRPVQV